MNLYGYYLYFRRFVMDNNEIKRIMKECDKEKDVSTPVKEEDVNIITNEKSLEWFGELNCNFKNEI